MSFGPKPLRAVRGQSKVLAELDKLGNQGLKMTAEGKADKEGATAEAETSDKTIFSKSLTAFSPSSSLLPSSPPKSFSDAFSSLALAQAQDLTLSADWAISTVLADGSSIGDVTNMERDNLEDLYYLNASDIAKRSTSGPSQAASNRVSGRPDENNAEMPRTPHAKISAKGKEARTSHQSFLDSIQEVLGKKTSDFEHSSFLDSDVARFLKCRASSVEKEQAAKWCCNENKERDDDVGGNESKNSGNGDGNGDKCGNDNNDSDKGGNERGKPRKDGDATEKSWSPGTVGNPIVMDNREITNENPEVYKIKTTVLFSISTYDLLVDSLGFVSPEVDWLGFGYREV
ncbi:uncharacterized protein PHACADRAFT_202001 [Phanerochaete carnosa HHB-10118-sp]|uniref:Uncharacterized protein n=1 Tax=Phanerochaete carnosa (strain HHB-10118-sp) TaxID=650164 RepID=K5UHV7_PHACS|nr:uncharacterized protein PHACADRAFT_202001 [Phanerochaete carnosa HHB-10118-sp]EKM49111.1 hypothetical protein PHACADRAFT_202001 [Phanerochaete carnosa HHB-10118-sp]